MKELRQRALPVGVVARDLLKLQALLAKMEAAADDARRFAALDLEFHVTLAEASENPLIADLVADMQQTGGRRALPPLFRSAEAYLRMWQRAVRHG